MPNTPNRHFKSNGISGSHGALCIAGWLLATMVSPVGAQEPDAEFGQKVRSYLLSNPEVILEVMDVLAVRQEEVAVAERIQPYRDALFASEMDLRLGSAEASKVIVEFFDYNCAACRANMSVLRAFVAANPDVAIVKKHLPILSPSSERAARFVLAARALHGEAVYRELHHAIYARQTVLSTERLIQFAQSLGLDAEPIKAEMQSNAITAIINAHRDIAIALNVIGTPTYMTERAVEEGSVTQDTLTALAAGA